jgi:hypothetical protein
MAGDERIILMAAIIHGVYKADFWRMVYIVGFKFIYGHVRLLCHELYACHVKICGELQMVMYSVSECAAQNAGLY